MTTRRLFLKAGACGALALAAGGALYRGLQARSPQRFNLDSAGRELLTALVPAIVGPALPSTTAQRRAAIDGTVERVRGAIERNVMRYYLAVDAYLASLKVPPDQRVEKRIQTWFNNTERYPRQLREMDRSTYVAMKRGEHVRQQAMIE